MDEEHGGIIERLLSLLTVGGQLAEGNENAAAEQIKDFIDKIPGGFFIYEAGKDEKILYANSALLRIFKCKNFSEFLAFTGGSFRGMVHPDDVAEVERSIAVQIEQSAYDLDYVEYRIICLDGAVRYVEDYGHFARTAVGDVFYVFISDATEKINRRLQERLQRLEIIEGLAVNYDSILYFNLENDTVLPYRLSDRMKEHFNEKWQVRKYNELIKEYISLWVHPDDRRSVTESLSPAYMCRVLAKTPTYYFNYRCIQGGEIIYLQLRIVNVGRHNTANRFVLGFRRVDDEILSEIKQKQILEDALKSAKLAEVAKNAFLANMSHDMRTPLNAISGYSAMARTNLADTQNVGYYLDRIDEAAKQILDLTANVLETSERNTQDYIVRREPCDLREILEDVYRTVKAQGEKKNLSVVLDTRALEHSEVIADGGKIKDILTYLSGNAVKFNKSGGSITLTATEKPHGDALRAYSIAVADTGVGISPDALERIFAPFEREKDTTESGISGAGLGLTLARHNAEMLGGRITVESVKGEGSKFTLTLNLEPEKADGKTADEVSADSLAGLKILLVEDNELNKEIATFILEDAGFIVDTAENGKVAVDKIKAAPEDGYDVVLMDIQMPVMDGRQATVAIRALGGRRAKLPVIALSANAFERDKRLSLEHGMDAHLTKPMDLDAIKKTIAEILNGRKKRG